MFKEFERELNSREKNILKKQIEFVEKEIPKRKYRVIINISILLIFILISVSYFSITLLIILLIISFFIIWFLKIEIPEIYRIPDFIKNKQKVIDNGIVKVQEIKIDRYIKIQEYGDEGSHYICEYDNTLFILNDWELLGIRKFKNKIEKIEILDSNKSGIYYDRIRKSGNSISPLYIVKNSLDLPIFKSELFDKLLSGEKLSGKLEIFDEYLRTN